MECINCKKIIPEKNLDLKPFCCIECREEYGIILPTVKTASNEVEFNDALYHYRI